MTGDVVLTGAKDLHVPLQGPRCRSFAPLRTTGALALIAVCAWQQPASSRAQVRALADAGRLDDAERVARAGGMALTESLGEVLVVRGRLSEADSVLRVALGRDAAGGRSAEAALAELALRRGDRVEALRRAGALASAYELRKARWSSDDLVAVGRAYVVLGTRSASAVKQALTRSEERRVGKECA